MTGTLKNITSRVSKVTGGLCYEYHFQVDDRLAKTYTGRTYKNFPRWKGLQVGQEVVGLKWKNEERGLIDADSPVKRVQATLL